MPYRRAATIFSLLASLAHAQTAAEDTALLTQARGKYDAPFTRNLKSFHCAVTFSWKQHWLETYRVGDEGTDAEIDKSTQPLPNRVTVTTDDALVFSGLTESQEQALPRGGMAEGLLKHAVRFSLRTWLVAANNKLLPAPGIPFHVEATEASYKLHLKIEQFQVAMLLNRDLSLESMAASDSDADRQELHFNPGPDGFLLNTWIMGEDGDFKAGNHLIFTYTYQTVSGFQLPSQVSINRESHHEVWRYALTGCKVATGNAAP